MCSPQEQLLYYQAGLGLLLSWHQQKSQPFIIQGVKYCHSVKAALDAERCPLASVPLLVERAPTST